MANREIEITEMIAVVSSLAVKASTLKLPVVPFLLEMLRLELVANLITPPEPTSAATPLKRDASRKDSAR
jgi:hypothetical protein